MNKHLINAWLPLFFSKIKLDYFWKNIPHILTPTELNRVCQHFYDPSNN